MACILSLPQKPQSRWDWSTRTPQQRTLSPAHSPERRRQGLPRCFGWSHLEYIDVKNIFKIVSEYQYILHKLRCCSWFSWGLEECSRRVPRQARDPRQPQSRWPRCRCCPCPRVDEGEALPQPGRSCTGRTCGRRPWGCTTPSHTGATRCLYAMPLLHKESKNPLCPILLSTWCGLWFLFSRPWTRGWHVTALWPAADNWPPLPGTTASTKSSSNRQPCHSLPLSTAQ